MNYGAIESIKNNRVLSAKYDSRLKRGKGMNHVVVFANWPPDYSKMSADRFIVKNLQDSDCVPLQPKVEGQPVIIVPTEEVGKYDNIGDFRRKK